VKVLLDTNVVLDVLLNRQPFISDSQQVWQATDQGRIDGYITATTVTDIFYLARKLFGVGSAESAIRVCLATFQICPVDRRTLEMALSLSGSDFEDNVQIACAL